MDFATMYLHNFAKRVLTDGKVYPAEVANAPRIIDKAYGDGDGHPDLDDVSEVASNIGAEIADKAGAVWDFITSLL